MAKKLLTFILIFAIVLCAGCSATPNVSETNSSTTTISQTPSSENISNVTTGTPSHTTSNSSSESSTTADTTEEGVDSQEGVVQTGGTTSTDTTTTTVQKTDGTTSKNTTTDKKTSTTQKQTTTTTTTTTTTKKQTTATTKKTTTTKKPTTTTTKKPTTTTTTKKPTTTTTNGSGFPDVDVEIHEFEAYMLELINADRVKAGLKPLKMSTYYHDCAEIRAEEASVHWGHDRPNGKLWHTVFEEQGKKPYGYTSGENLGDGFMYSKKGVDLIYAALYASPGHKANMMNAQFTEVAIAIYWTKRDDLPTGYTGTVAQLFFGKLD